MGKFITYRKMELGGPPTKVLAKQFLSTYMSSPIYKKRLDGMGVTGATNISNLMNTNITNEPGYGSFYMNKNKSKNFSDNTNLVGIGFDKSKPNINIDRSQVYEMKDLTGHPETADNVLAHELSHSARTLSTKENSVISSANIKDTFPGFDHDNKPNEIKADIDALRFMMFKKGIYDTSKRDMTTDDFNKAKSDKDISNSMIFNRLQKHLKPEDLIKLNNTIAVNKTQDSQLSVAKFGGNIGMMKKKIKPMGKFASKMQKMEGGGYPDPPIMQNTGPNSTGGAFNWANKNASLLSTGSELLGAGVDVIAPTDKYGVRSNGAAAASGLLKGAGTGAAIGSAIPVFGTAAGAIVGGTIGAVTGLLGNKKANKEKTETINKSTQAQLSNTIATSEAQVAADPSLRYGRMSASYYRMGGTIKPTVPGTVRTTKPIPKVQPAQRLMPNIFEVPGRQISRLSNGGALRFTSSKLYKGFKPLKSQLAAMANGGTIQPLSSEDVKINGASHANGGVKFPNQGVELEGGETMNDGFVFSKKLGFADKQEKVAKALGKTEKQPETVINKNTISALKRKSELLKVQQEQTKAAMGIPNDLEQKAMGGMLEDGPGFPGKVTKADSTKGPTYDKSLLTNGKFLVTKADGTTGQWGNPLPSTSTALPQIPTPAILPSDKAAGYSNTYYPSRAQQTGPSVPVQHRSWRYKMGGKLYDDGGLLEDPDDPKVKKKTIAAKPPVAYTMDMTNQDPKVVITGKRTPKFPLPGTPADPTMPTIPGLDIADSQVADNPAFPSPIIPAGVTPKAGAVSNGKVWAAVNGVADKVTPFISNIVNATTKLPFPTTPNLTPEITPNLVDYSASRNEAVRQTRSADESARRNLNTGAAVSATKAANLAGQERAVGQINEAENNTNAQIRNSTAAENAQIRTANNGLLNNYQNELTSRKLKSQELKSQNFANVEEKIQGMSRDKKMFDLEDQKAMLGWLQNNDSGAGYDAVRDIFAKHLSSDSLKKMDDQVAKQRTERAQDRAETVKMGKLQLQYLKAKGTQPDNPYDLVGKGISAVNSAKDEQADSKTRIKKKE